MKKYVIGAVIGLLFCGTAWASGSIPAAFADIGLARMSGMGKAFVAVADDASSVFYNPAGIATSSYKDMTFMYAKQKFIIPYNYFAFIYPISKLRGIGFGTIISGDTLFSEKTFMLSYSENLDRILVLLKDVYAGASFKLHFAGYGDNESDDSPLKVQGGAWGVGMDFGFLWDITSQVRFGLMLRDTISWLTWSSNRSDSASEEGVPLTTDVGLRYRISEFLGTVEISDMHRIKIGLEQTLFRYIDLRAGYTRTLDIEHEQEYALGLGVGKFEFGAKREFSMNFDFSFAFERLENTFKAQTSFKFK